MFARACALPPHLLLSAPLGRYDVDEAFDDLEGDEDLRMALVQKNKPGNWVKVRATPKASGPEDAMAAISAAGGAGAAASFSSEAQRRQSVKLLKRQARKKASRKGRSAEEVAEEMRHYYVNVVTGDAQWNRPLFTLGPPRLADFAACAGPEDDPETWIRVEAPGTEPYYYNTVTKRSCWSAPRFSGHWEKAKAERDAELAGRGTGALRRPSTWAGFSGVGTRGFSGFRPVFGPGARPPKPTTVALIKGTSDKDADKGARSKSMRARGASQLKISLKGSGGSMRNILSPAANKDSDAEFIAPLRQGVWDAAFSRDPAVSLGGWTVNSCDERTEAFERAAKSLLDEELARNCTLGTGATELEVEASWPVLCARAEEELAELRRARMACFVGGPAADREIATKGDALRPVRLYTTEEHASLLRHLRRRGLVSRVKRSDSPDPAYGGGALIGRFEASGGGGGGGVGGGGAGSPGKKGKTKKSAGFKIDEADVELEEVYPDSGSFM